MIFLFGTIIIATVVGIGWMDLRSGMRLLERYDPSGPSRERRPPPDPTSRGTRGAQPTIQP